MTLKELKEKIEEILLTHISNNDPFAVMNCRPALLSLFCDEWLKMVEEDGYQSGEGDYARMFDFGYRSAQHAMRTKIKELQDEKGS